jgi:hypothetical protein
MTSRFRFSDEWTRERARFVSKCCMCGDASRGGAAPGGPVFSARIAVAPEDLAPLGRLSACSGPCWKRLMAASTPLPPTQSALRVDGVAAEGTQGALRALRRATTAVASRKRPAPRAAPPLRLEASGAPAFEARAPAETREWLGGAALAAGAGRLAVDALTLRECMEALDDKIDALSDLRMHYAQIASALGPDRVLVTDPVPVEAPAWTGRAASRGGGKRQKGEPSAAAARRPKQNKPLPHIQPVSIEIEEPN